MGYYRRRRRYYGWGYARRHLSEAAQLSKDVGGTDEDVKAYFFDLSSSQLRPILNAYEREHGKSARKYAERTIANWRSGATQMSGAVATRLYKLLPRFMPLEQKYALVESLWTKFAPRTEHSVSFGRNADARTITETVRNHVNTTVNDHAIPDNLKCRFQWLADGDSRLMEQLLNYFLDRDKKDAVALQHAVVSMILPHLESGDALTGFKREVKIGGHIVHIFFDPRAKEVKLSHGSPRYISPPDYSGIGTVIVVAAIIALIWLFNAKP